MNRRGFLSGAAAAALTAGCSPAFPDADAEAAYPPIGRFVEVEGLRVHAVVAGPEGTQPVVLVHGASGNLRDWTFSIAPRIAAKRRVIALDRPGFGYTERPDERGWHPAVQARILRGAAAELGAERPIVVGHSWGGAVAMSWALDAPAATAGVVPVSGVTMPYGSRFGRALGALGISDAITWAYTEYMKATAEDGGIDRFIARVFSPQSPPAGYVDYVGAPLALREATLDANSEDIGNLGRALREMAPRYGGLALPVEIVHGDADFIDPSRHALGLEAAVPGARLTMLRGVGHMAHHAGTEALLAAIDRVDAAANA